MSSSHSSRTTSINACDLSASIGADHSERGTARECSRQGCTTVGWDGVHLRSTHGNDRVEAPPSPFGLEASSLGPSCTVRASGPSAKDRVSPKKGFASHPGHEVSDKVHPPPGSLQNWQRASRHSSTLAGSTLWSSFTIRTRLTSRCFPTNVNPELQVRNRSSDLRRVDRRNVTTVVIASIAICHWYKKTYSHRGRELDQNPRRPSRT